MKLHAIQTITLWNEKMAEFPSSGEFNNAHYFVINIYNSPKSVPSFPRLT